MRLVFLFLALVALDEGCRSFRELPGEPAYVEIFPRDAGR